MRRKESDLGRIREIYPNFGFGTRSDEKLWKTGSGRTPFFDPTQTSTPHSVITSARVVTLEGTKIVSTNFYIAEYTSERSVNSRP